jgi:hypothetical protein
MGRNGTSDRAGNVAIAESQPAVHYRSQVVFDRARLDRHKKLAAALGDVSRRNRRPRTLVALHDDLPMVSVITNCRRRETEDPGGPSHCTPFR